MKIITIENHGKRDAFLSASNTERGIRAQAIKVSKRNWPYIPATHVHVVEIENEK
jgi:hypothetical protein